LRNTISDCGNSKRAEFRPLDVFGNVDSPSGQGPKQPLFKLPHQPVEVSIQVLFEHPDADFVDSRRTAISPYGSPSFEHQLGSNPSCQAMDFDLSLDHVLTCVDPVDRSVE
jgi:hypothetical protein